MSVIVDGKALAAEIRANIKEEVSALTKNGRSIVFAAVIVGDDPASKVYIQTKQKACTEVGIQMQEITLPASVTQSKLNKILRDLSKDSKVHGILLQLPLPQGLNSHEAIENIVPIKDIDGLTAENFGKLASEKPKFVPCTALGVLHILKSHNIKTEGANAVIIGRSNIVGKPVAMLLQKENTTVTVCHKLTRNLSSHTKHADIIVVAAGAPGLVKGNMIKKGAAIIDVGITRAADKKLYGDVDFESTVNKASILTPVPGGVGPLTIAFLLNNILQAYKLQQNKKDKTGDENV